MANGEVCSFSSFYVQLHKSAQRNACACLKSLPLFVLIISTIYFKYTRKDENIAQYITCMSTSLLPVCWGRGDFV